MSSVLISDPVVDALRELREIGEREDARYRQRVKEKEAELGVTLGAADRAPFAVDAPLAISPEVGEVLHALVLAARPALVVEFGASLGISTIYLASAIADLGTGRVITTELVPEKAQRTEAMLDRASLGEHVEILAGDAMETMRRVDEPVGLLFLDGANDLYLDVVELLEPQLTPTALIIADMSSGDKNHDAYRAYVNDASTGLVSTEVSLNAGLVISTLTS